MMFSNIFKKVAVFGASTVAGVALSGAIATNSAQAASMTYRSEFSVTSNTFNNDFITGDFDFTKTELDSGGFSYEVTGFNANVLNEEFTLSDIRKKPNQFGAINQIFVPESYQAILQSAINGKNSDIVNSDLGEGNSTFTFGFDFGDGNFQADQFDFDFTSEDLDNAAELASNLITSIPSNVTRFSVYLSLLEGGQINVTTKNVTTKAVPEPTTLFGIGVVTVGLAATRRKRASKKIKQKAAA
ncbi:MAG: PEP-CTERM sorting domain-containing protein [Rivularia sp. (in: cyanobacteria)]